MFDEPLTVIDPHLKWQLRSKLKELHQRTARTMIYVTHDQTEALTFADKVVVMHEGAVVQIGSPVELFERPAHTFVGHFIGSPGMNFLPVNSAGGMLDIAGTRLAATRELPEGALKLGIRPEYVALVEPGAPGAVPATLTQLQDVGTHLMLSAQVNGSALKARLASEAVVPAPGATVWLKVLGVKSCFYRDEELVA